MAVCSCGSVFSRSDNLKRHQRNCLSDINHVKKVILENPVKIGLGMDLVNDNKGIFNFDKTIESDDKGVDFSTNFKNENLDIENVRKYGNGYDEKVSKKELTTPRIERSGKSKISFDSDDDVDNEADDEADSSVPEIRVKRFRKSKIFHDSSDDEVDEEVDEDVVRKPSRKRIRISRKSQDGSGTDSKRLNKMVNYSGESDIFSKNRNDSNESDSEDNLSEVSDEELDDGGSRICYCRDCQSKSSKKNIKNQYIHSGESENQSEVSEDNESDSFESEICYCRNCHNKPSNVKNQYVHSNESDDDKEIDIGKEFNVKLKNNPSESDNDMGIDIGKESNVKLKNNPYNQYYESQALGGRVFSTIIGNHTGTNNVGGALSSLYRSSFRIPVTMRNGISRENYTNYGNTSPVSSYLNY